MASVTAENASAMQVILGTTVTARQTSAHARPGMATSAATVGTAKITAIYRETLKEKDWMTSQKDLLQIKV